MAHRFKPAEGLDREVAETFLRPAVEKTRDRLIEVARAEAPVDTGTLKTGITGGPVHVTGTKVNAEVTAHAIDPEDGYDYAAITEFGGKHERPDPFMRRAASQVQNQR